MLNWRSAAVLVPIWICVVASVAGPAVKIERGGLTISSLEESDISYGCGCSFHYPVERKAKGGIVLQWAVGGKAAMRINGALLRLDVVGDKESRRRKDRESIGDRRIFSLAGSGIEVTAHCTAAWVCPRDNGSCEVTWYRAQLKVKSDKGSASIPVWGGCGC